MRFAGAVDSMRTELRGMNERLHRIIEKFSQRRDGGAIASA
jgi:hypothetical protein